MAPKNTNVNDIGCHTCERGDREDALLLCDTCDRAHHTDCVGLAKVPSTEFWYCPKCVKNALKAARENEWVSTYVRVSSPGQNEPEFGRIGLDSQQRAINKYVEAEGLEIEATYTDVGTGRAPERLEALMQLVEELYPSASILVYSVSRLARNAAAGRRLLDTIHSQGAQVYSICERAWSYDAKTGGISEKFLTGLAQAAAESNALSRRMKDAFQHIVDSGGHLGRAPFGFSIVRDPESGVRKTTPNPQEQTIVKKLKTYFVACDCNYTETSRQLNAKSYWFRNNQEWSPARVKTALEWN